MIEMMRTMRASALALAFGTMACGAPQYSHSTDSSPTDAPVPTPTTCKPTPEVSEDVTVKNAVGRLRGTLVLPEGCGPHTVALIVAGSGPTDRDGDQSSIHARPYRLLAEALATSGIGSLRYDKAGVGASKGAIFSEATLRFEMGADDAALFVEALRADERVGRVIMVGHSEGSLVGMLAAQRASVDGFVSLAGAGRPAGDVLREQLGKNLRDPELQATAFSILSSLEQGERVDDVPSELNALFRPSVQGYLISWLKYDPAEVLRTLSVDDILLVQGTTDIQVPVGDAERLAAARSDARLLVIEGMNHVLKKANMSSQSQQDAYTNPELPLVPMLVRELSAFMKP